MPENEQKDKPGASGGTNNYIKFTGVAFQMIAIIGVFAYVGHLIDKSAQHSTQWVTAMLALIGVFIALYAVIKQLKE